MSDPALITLTTSEILDSLNNALLAERQAVVDYDAHAQACDQSGAPHDIQEALETLRDVEHEHALRIVMRITTLGGKPTNQEVKAQPMGDTLASWLAQDLQGEQWAIVEYARLIAGIMDDEETVSLMAELLLDEIRHADWLKTTLCTLQTK